MAAVLKLAAAPLDDEIAVLTESANEKPQVLSIPADTVSRFANSGGTFTL